MLSTLAPPCCKGERILGRLNGPEGIIHSGSEWYFAEYAPGAGVSSLGLQDGAEATPQVMPVPAADEKKKILDLFKN